MSMFDDDDETTNAVATSPFSEPDEEEARNQPEAAPPPVAVPDSAPGYANEGPLEEVEQPEQTVATSSGDEEWMKPIPVPAPVNMASYKDATPQLEALKSQYSKEATEKTKPSGWRRLVAGLAGGAVTFGSGNPYAGATIADNINSAPRRAAEERWKLAEKPLAQDYTNVVNQNAQIQRENQTRIQQGNEADRNYRNQAYAQYQNGRVRDFAAQAAARRNAPVAFTPDNVKNPYAGGTVRTADGRMLKNQPPPDKWIQAWRLTPQGKTADEDMEVNGRQQLATRMGLKQGSEAYNNFVFKTPLSTHTSIDIRENPDGSPVKPKSGGMTQAQKDVILQAKHQAMAKAQDDMAKGLLQPEDALKAMQAAQDTFEQKVGVDVNGPDHLRVNPDFSWSNNRGQNVGKSEPNGQPAAAPAQPAAQPKQAAQPAAPVQQKAAGLKVGDPITVGGKPATFMGYNPKTGKAIIGPPSQGNGAQ